MKKGRYALRQPQGEQGGAMRMQLVDLMGRTMPPRPWAEGENIPWNEREFSARMLHEHLSQAHDAASRRETIIERQVGWIHGTLLSGKATTVLDLGCGPGLYTNRLGRLGHTCVGIDYSPTSIEYAQERAAEEQLACRYELRDIRGGSYGAGHGLAMLIYGELNVFPRETAAGILREMNMSLMEGGTLLLEVHTLAAVQALGEREAEWYTADYGVFGDVPYLCLTEYFWHAEIQAATTRYYVVDAASAVMTRYAQTMQAYTEEEYRALLGNCGFGKVAFHTGLASDGELEQPGLQVITASRG
jgi:SAM-dependent methyltransferase